MSLAPAVLRVESQHMEYTAVVTHEDDTQLVSFPDLPGCHTEVGPGDDFDAIATEALDLWLADALEHREVPPVPGKHRAPRGGTFRPVRVSPVLASRVQLRQRRAAAGLSQADLAARVGVSQQQIALLESPDGDIKLGTLDRVAEALGLHLTVSFAA